MYFKLFLHRYIFLAKFEIYITEFDFIKAFDEID